MRILISGYGGKTGDTAGVYDLSEHRFIWNCGIKSISFMCNGDNGAFFGAGEHDDHGFVYMFTPDAGGGFKLADTVRIDGGALCHIAYSGKHKILTGACYASGDIFSLEVKPEGFGEMKSYMRQGGGDAEISRAHCTVFSEDENELYSNNIALDKVFRYEIKNGALYESGQRQLDKGIGPRHFKIINGRQYIITEYSDEIILLEENYPRVSTLPQDFTGKSSCSTMCFLPVNADCGYLYAANRGADTVAVFKLNNTDGLLEKIHDCDCGGQQPRHIEILNIGGEPVLAAANQRNGEAVFFKIKENGSLGEITLTVPFGGVSYIGAVKTLSPLPTAAVSPSRLPRR